MKERRTPPQGAGRRRPMGSTGQLSGTEPEPFPAPQMGPGGASCAGGLKGTLSCTAAFASPR